MLRVLLCPLLFLFATHLIGQVNLVPNPSFEYYTDCPYGYSLIDEDPDIFPFVSDWMKPTSGTSDYYNGCADVYSAVMPPYAAPGFQIPHSGDAFSGMYTQYSSDYREYVQARLTSPLVAGQVYYAGFYVNAAVVDGFWGCGRTTDDIGMYISTDRITDLSGWTHLAVTPQIENTEGFFFSDTSSWYLVSGNYIATGGEEWVTIGNFYNQATTDYDVISGEGNDCVYVYVDDVFVMEASVLPLTLTSFSGLWSVNMQSVVLNWETAAEINNCCFIIGRSFDGKTFTDIGTVTGKGDGSHSYAFSDYMPCTKVGYYRLRMQSNDGSSSYSTSIAVQPNSGNLVHAYSYRNKIIIDNGTENPIAASFYNLNSEEIARKEVQIGRTEWQPNVINNKIYILVLKNNQSGETLLVKKLTFIDQ